MADAIAINQWVRSLLLALRGACDSLEYAVSAGDKEGTSVLATVGRGFVSEPWHVFMSAVPGWAEEVERYHSLVAAIDPSPVAQDEAQAWSEVYWESAERQIATDIRLEQRRRRREVER